MPRHTHQDALSEREYRHLLDACGDLDDPYRRECEFVVVVAGRLGLRAGELAHIDESWIDWEHRRLQIPAFDECTNGEDGGICGYCRARAKEQAETLGIDVETALSRRWEPKTSHGSRAVPFDFDAEVESVVSNWFWDHDGWPLSRAAVNRRVDKVAAAAGLELYPHALRATAATNLAYRGVPAAALQSMMGWSQLSTAQKYLRLSGEATSRALNDAYSD